ncbi:MAG: hypothetical protein ACRDPY_49915 [Streptosporangiaceae bacterium]
MPNRSPGARYPHATTDAREADHTWCPVLAAVAARVAAGREQWGAVQGPYPVPGGQPAALEAKRGLYRARGHTGRRRGGCGALALSVRADTGPDEAGGWQVWFQVWDRAQAKREIVRRVRAGESLAYNVRRTR